MYVRAYTHEHQFSLLGGLASRMTEEPFRLVVIMCCALYKFLWMFCKSIPANVYSSGSQFILTFSAHGKFS